MGSLPRRLAAEALGTAWLVLGGCGTAVLAGHLVDVHGVALAFGLAVVTMAYAIGHVSGCHLNPAVTLGLVVAGRFPKREVLPYWFAQLVGAVAAGMLLYVIAKGRPGFVLGGFATNGFGDHSPGRYSLEACLATEVVLTFFFLLVILGATSARASGALAGLAIGLCLTLIHLISIPITGTSVNPARSTGVAVVTAVFGTADAIQQLWVFWLAPLGGAVLAGLLWPFLAREPAASD